MKPAKKIGVGQSLQSTHFESSKTRSLIGLKFTDQIYKALRFLPILCLIYFQAIFKRSKFPKVE